MPYYFAMGAEGETFNAGTHSREDFKVISFDLGGEENKIPSLTIVVKNPMVGLLSGDLWIWFSRSGTPLFHGRLVGIPTEVKGPKVTLLFTARASDWGTQQLAIAETLKVRPGWDPAAIDPTMVDDPNTILEGYSKLWHTDRISGVVSVSDIIVGEDGDLEYNTSDLIYSSFNYAVGQPPVPSCKVTMEATWSQRYSGDISAGVFLEVFDADGSFVSSWPKPGQSIGGGWHVTTAFASNTRTINGDAMVSASFSWQNKEEEHEDGDTMSIQESYSHPMSAFAASGPLNEERKAVYGDPISGTAASASYSFDTIYAVGNTGLSSGVLNLGYDAKQARKETVIFTVVADEQALFVDPVGDAGATIPNLVQISLNDVGVPLEGDTVPLIGSLASDSYFQQDRGHWTIEYGLSRARAFLLDKVRAVTVTFEVPIVRAISDVISCRKNVILHDPRLPGGISVGKITSYHMLGDGNTGRFTCQITFECAVGTGSTLASPAGGTGQYGDVAYMGPDYQVFDGAQITTGEGDLLYEPPSGDTGGFKFPLSGSGLVTTVFHDGSNQRAAMFKALREAEDKAVEDHQASLSGGNTAPQIKVIRTTSLDVATQTAAAQGPSLEVTLQPVDNLGPIETTYTLNISTLIIPKQIDLSAL